MSNEIDLTDKITKTCPFLDKLCISYDCPSFYLERNSYQKTRDGVLLLKEEKGKIFTKIKEVPMAVQFAWSYSFKPTCKVLGERDRWGYNPSLVGERFEIVQEVKPRWIRVNCWISSWEKVVELPEIQSSSTKANEKI